MYWHPHHPLLPPVEKCRLDLIGSSSQSLDQSLLTYKKRMVVDRPALVSSSLKSPQSQIDLRLRCLVRPADPQVHPPNTGWQEYFLFCCSCFQYLSLPTMRLLM